MNASFSRHALPVAGLALLILAAFWKLTTMQGLLITDDIFTSDVANGFYPFYAFMGASLRSGQMPLWIPSVYTGFPFIGTGIGVCYPFTMLLTVLVEPAAALNLMILLALCTAAVGMYLYAREIGADTPGAMLAGISFGLSGFLVSHLKHVSMVESVVWLPLGLLLIEKGLRRWEEGRRDVRPFAWFGLLFGLQLLAGFPQTAYYSGLISIAYFVTALVTRRHRLVRGQPPTPLALAFHPVTRAFGMSLVAGSLLAGVQLLPTYELVQHSQRSSGVTYAYATAYPYDPADLSMFLYPLARGEVADATYRGSGIFWEDYGYAGLLPLLLAIYGASRRWQDRRVRFFAVGAGVAMLLVLGGNTPFYRVAFLAIPGMSFFRFPTRFLFFVDAAIALLAAAGATDLARRSRSRPLPWVVLSVTALEMVFFQTRQNAVVDAALWRAPPRSATRLRADSSLFRIYSPGATESHKAAFAQARGWSEALEPYLAQREFIQVNSNVLFGLASPEGYIPLAPNEVVDIWGDMNRPGLIMNTAAVQGNMFVPRKAFCNLVSLFNVKYLLSAWPVSGGGFTALGTSGMVHLYENPAVMPRAFFVGGYRLASNSAAARRVLLDDAFAPDREVLLSAPPVQVPARAEGRGEARITSSAAQEVSVHVSCDAPGYLVLSDLYFPGWRAEVDGIETPVAQGNLCQRVVPVRAGEHDVRFVYAPASVTYGLLLSLAGLALIVIGGTWRATA